MTDRQDADYDDDPLAPHENQAVRRTVDDVDEINQDRRFWRTVRAHAAVAIKLAFAVPVAVVATMQALTWLSKFFGKVP